eukprot:scaffold434_cov186-Pinguiococcus_pyrenoidosus.AAC.22
MASQCRSAAASEVTRHPSFRCHCASLCLLSTWVHKRRLWPFLARKTTPDARYRRCSTAEQAISPHEHGSAAAQHVRGPQVRADGAGAKHAEFHGGLRRRTLRRFPGIYSGVFGAVAWRRVRFRRVVRGGITNIVITIVASFYFSRFHAIVSSEKLLVPSSEATAEYQRQSLVLPLGLLQRFLPRQNLVLQISPLCRPKPKDGCIAAASDGQSRRRIVGLSAPFPSSFAAQTVPLYAIEKASNVRLKLLDAKEGALLILVPTCAQHSVAEAHEAQEERRLRKKRRARHA